MFKLVYERHNDLRDKWQYEEENFTDGEKRTAVEIARLKRSNPDKYRNVRVIDYTFVKAEVVTVTKTLREPNAETGRLEFIASSTEISRQTLKVPACELLDLDVLPRKKAPAKATKKIVRLLGVPVASANELKPKKARTKKAVKEEALVTA